MDKDTYLVYDQQSIYNFTSKALDSYKVLTKYLESTTNSDKYFKMLFTEKKEFHNFLYGEVALENDTVNNVMGNAVSILYLIANSKEADIKDERITNYLYYAIWNINNTLISTFESLLISLLEDIFLACKLSSNMNTIIYYSLCFIAIFLFTLFLIFITYGIWRKKNSVAQLLLDVNIKAYTKIKDVCEELRMNLQVLYINRMITILRRRMGGRWQSIMRTPFFKGTTQKERIKQ